MDYATGGTMERAHGLGVMGNARTGIISTALDSQLQTSHQKELSQV